MKKSSNPSDDLRPEYDFSKLTRVSRGLVYNRRMMNVKELELQHVTDQSGAKTGVLVPIDEFEELMEDIEDLAAIAERRDEPTIPHDELVAELKRDGLI